MSSQNQPKNNDDYFKIEIDGNKVGRPRKFTTPGAMAIKFNEYADFVKDNPLKEGVAFHNKGTIVKHGLKRMRAMSLEGFCVFAKTTIDTFKNYEKLPTTEETSPTEKKRAAEFLALCTRIREIVFAQQYEGAAANLLNHAVVVRKLGLAEVTKNANINLGAGDVSPEIVKKISDALEEKY